MANESGHMKSPYMQRADFFMKALNEQYDGPIEEDSLNGSVWHTAEANGDVAGACPNNSTVRRVKQVISSLRYSESFRSCTRATLEVAMVQQRSRTQGQLYGCPYRLG